VPKLWTVDYRKLWVAVLGALLQVLAVADGASQAGILPDAWVPWVAAAVATATAWGVYRAPNGRPVSIRRHRAPYEDFGQVRAIVVSVLGLLAVAALLVLVMVVGTVAMIMGVTA
jgi:hypothetical protein